MIWRLQSYIRTFGPNLQSQWENKRLIKDEDN